MKKNNYFQNLKFFTDQQKVLDLIYDLVYFFLNSKEKIDIKEFNKNKIDPIKLIFDYFTVHDQNLNQTINAEKQRQRDKSKSNKIGEFHENLVSLLPNCRKTNEFGFDIEFINKNQQKILIELKNKHNTMNSSSASATYKKMEKALLSKNVDFCYLVEIISKKSQKINWKHANEKKLPNQNIFKISIDRFYWETTGQKLSFWYFCDFLPKIINNIMEKLPKELQFLQKNEIQENNKNYSLSKILNESFKDYVGFKK